MQDCNTLQTPFDSNLILSAKDSPDNDQKKLEMKNVPYREVVSSLMFAAIVLRPDIMYAVSQISRFLNNPGKKHWTAAKRILRYLKGTINAGIIYKGNNCELKVYIDVDFANDKDNRKSISGYISVLANAPITWSSKQQSCVARSTAEAEYVSASQYKKLYDYGYYYLSY